MSHFLKNLTRRFFTRNLSDRGSGDGLTLEKGAQVVASEEVIDVKLKILNEGWGHARSRQERRPIDQSGNPLPWYTYPAIEYIRQLDLTRLRVFEWGAGGSSLFWSSQCKEVITIERKRDWFEKVSETAPLNLTVYHVDNDQEYPDEITKHGMFDVIAIDGNQRQACAERALKHWCNGGLIILDNSDWYTAAAGYLRQNGLVQVDFSGFGPINDYTWSTSVFFRGEFNFKPKGIRLPMHGVGAIETLAEEDEGRIE